MNFGETDYSRLNRRAELFASVMSNVMKNRQVQMEQEKKMRDLEEYNRTIVPRLNTLNPRQTSVPESTIENPQERTQFGVGNAQTVPAHTETTYPSGDEARGAYQGILSASLANPQNPYLSGVTPTAEKMYDLSTRGDITPENRARLEQDKAQLEQKKLVDSQNFELRRSDLARKTQSDKDRAQSSKMRAQAYKDYTTTKTQAQQILGAVLERSADGKLSLRKDMPTNLVLKAQQVSEKKYRAALNHHDKIVADISKNVEFRKMMYPDNQELQTMTPSEQQQVQDANDEILDARDEVGAFSPGGSAKPTQDNQQQLSPEDQQAIEWAKANPNDPRSAKILELHKQK